MFTKDELNFIHQQMQITARQAQITLQTSMACLRKIEIMSRPPDVVEEKGEEIIEAEQVEAV